MIYGERKGGGRLAGPGEGGSARGGARPERSENALVDLGVLANAEGLVRLLLEDAHDELESRRDVSPVLLEVEGLLGQRHG